MEYETADGSQFSLREVRVPLGTGGYAEYTSVSAYVDGTAYCGRLDLPVEEIEDEDVLGCLTVVPEECIHPPFHDGFTLAQPFDASVHYLKTPSFTYDDCDPGKTFVADCLLNEVESLELLRSKPHHNIARYHGCVVKDGRITHICLERYPQNLIQHAEGGLSESERTRISKGIRAGVEHLHSLGLAHNDINPGNICIDSAGEPIIIDFDGCLPFGRPLLKGSGDANRADSPVSDPDNDLLYGIPLVEEFLDDINEVEQSNRPDPSDDRAVP